MMTGLTTRKESTDTMDNLTLNAGYILDNREKFTESQITDFSTPQPDHSFEIQGLKDQHIVQVGQMVSQLEKPVPSLVRDSLVFSGEVVFNPLAVIRSFLFSGQLQIQSLNPIDSLLEKLRGLDSVRAFTIVDGQEILETKIESRYFTSRGFRLWDFLPSFNREKQVQMIELVSFDGHSLDLTLRQSIIDQLIDMVTDSDLSFGDELPASLLEGVRFILGYLTKRGRTGLDASFEVAKEKLIASLNSLTNILQGLRWNQLEPVELGQLFEFSQMLHQSVLIKMLASQPVVPFVQGNAVIPGQTSQVDRLVKMLILFRLVQLQLEGFSHQLFLE